MRSNTAYSEERNNFALIKDGEKKEIDYDKAMNFQKILGFVALGLTTLEFFANYKGWIDEGGIFLFALPLGLYLVFKRDLVL